MFKVFTFGFETRIKTISPLINRLINEVLLVAYTTFQSDTASAHRRPSLVSDKHVLVCMLYYVVFMQPGMKLNDAY